MGILSWIVVGAIAGFLANMVMGTREGLFMTILLGVLGGLIGGFVASALSMGTVDGLNVTSIVIATIGAIILLAIRGLMSSSGRRTA